jgi:hypothetical protein
MVKGNSSPKLESLDGIGDQTCCILIRYVKLFVLPNTLQLGNAILEHQFEGRWKLYRQSFCCQTCCFSHVHSTAVSCSPELM